MSTRIIAVLALLAGGDGGVSGAGLGGGAAEAGLEAPAPASPLSAGLEAVDFGCVVTGQPVAYRVQIDNTALASVGPLEVRLSPSTAMLSILVDGCSGL